MIHADRFPLRRRVLALCAAAATGFSLVVPANAAIVAKPVEHSAENAALELTPRIHRRVPLSPQAETKRSTPSPYAAMAWQLLPYSKPTRRSRAKPSSSMSPPARS
ncbi:hypothetical protein [Corynebacterium striatum]|uniref:hypothetical protein n=1 Tax=Corynebacterium striatum TaxID=43770 RepID=UPI000E02327C|nr:hypothetical protein [Corynebacterium striatum]MDK8808074.1 hypothetical protein [Corynebacterium striatum]STD62488.1 alkaline phosphatase [Corynebacterium striatum]